LLEGFFALDRGHFREEGFGYIMKNWIYYTETHLEGGIEDSDEDKVNFAKDLSSQE